MSENKPSFFSSTLTLALAAACLLAGTALLVAQLIHEEEKTVLTPRHNLATFGGRDLKGLSNLILTPGKAYLIQDRHRTLLDSKLFTNSSTFLRPVDAFLISSDPPLWASPNVALSPIPEVENGWLAVPKFNIGVEFAPFILLGLALLIAAGRWMERSGTFAAIWVFYCLCGVCGLLTLFYLTGFHLAVEGGDARQFHDMAGEWLCLDRKSEIPNNVGAALFVYLPLRLLFQADQLYDIIAQAHLLNYVVAGLGSLGLILWIARKLNAPHFHLTAICAACYPVFAFTWYAQDQTLVYAQSLLYLGRCFPFENGLYNKCFLTAWNPLSDNLAVFFILLGVLIMLRAPDGIARYIALGLSLGLSMSMRYGSVAILPAVFFWDLTSLIKDKKPWPAVAWRYAVFAAAGLAGLAPQLIDNFLVQGNCLRPTVAPELLQNGNGVASFFAATNILSGLRFFTLVFFKNFLLFTFALYFIRNMKIAVFLFLAFVCPLLFYASLDFHMHNCIRYLVVLFPLTYLAVGMLPGSIDRKRMVFFAAAFTFVFAFICPVFPEAPNILGTPWILNYALPGAVVAVTVALAFLDRRHKWQHAAFAVLISLMAMGWWWLVPLGLGFFPIYLFLRRKYGFGPPEAA